jgi:uncharacterized protein
VKDMKDVKVERKEFFNIVSDILENEHFQELKNEKHHGTSRYNHSVRVAIKTYMVARSRGWSYVEITRAALLHDFYTNKDIKNVEPTKALVVHPKMAAKNAKKYFNVSKRVQDMIRTHMYPVTSEMPKSKEALLISLIDKEVGTIEMLKYKLIRRPDVPKEIVEFKGNQKHQLYSILKNDLQME